MMRTLIGLFLASISSANALAEDVSVRTIKAYSTKLSESPTGALAAFMIGTPQQSNLYVITAMYPAGRIGKPHSHPDQRVLTVISGTFYAGIGPIIDEAKMQALTPGSVIIIPANVLHWGMAKDGDALVQEVGNGPTSNIFPASK